MAKVDNAMTRWAEAQTTVGRILDGEARRDAIHFAVAPVVAGEAMLPGAHVGLDDDGAASLNRRPIGIVDPFLQSVVRKGQKFWLFLYPNTITTLRHVWEHPAFGAEQPEQGVLAAYADKKDSEQWIRDFVERADCGDYDTLMRSIEEEERCDREPEYLTIQGMDASGNIPAELWRHVEVVLGRKLKFRKKPSYFSCSC